ncbi:tyrosine-type recombinase/integrase [Streptomyces sp. NPDC007861]|uniref:tyrosine-type recombinase/integrase n=1 Tax=Streptomyces sp. NPDC007861 TaxID=3154893 RepID=UPI0033F01E37
MHDLRRSHASWLIAAKVPLPAIQDRPGHESITTTADRYGHPRLCQGGPTHETPAHRPVAVHGHEKCPPNRVSAG